MSHEPRTSHGAAVAEPPTSCVIEIRVRYFECDPMGVLHHARFFEYFELGRTELLRRSGLSYRDCEAQGVFFVVTKLACDYRKPARYDDLLRLETRIDRITRVRIDHAYRMMRDDVLVCEATSTIACLDRNGKPQLIPDLLRLS